MLLFPEVSAFQPDLPVQLSLKEKKQGWITAMNEQSHTFVVLF
jgi:hypothetical protein